MTRFAALAAGAALMLLGVGTPELTSSSATAAEQARGHTQHRAARARPQRGTASYYAPRFHGRRMANGRRFDARSNSAASRTLPLGTEARVTNLENGRTATVTVEDRGPYVGNRLIDVSPRTAEVLDMKQDGLAPVEVTPTRVPDQDERHPAQ